MNYTRFFLIAIAALFLILPVNAELINTTILLTTNYGGELHLATASTETGFYTYSAPDNNMIVFTMLYPRSEGQVLNWRLVRTGGGTIYGSLQTQSTGIFSGNSIATIDGGSTSTKSYVKLTSLLIYNPPMNIFFTKGDSYYYLVVADTSRFNYAVSGDVFHPVYAPFVIDTTTDCYLQLSSNPTDYPPETIVISSPTSGSYIVTPYYESIQDAQEAEIYTNRTQTSSTSGNTLSFLTTLVNAITSAYNALQKFFSVAGQLSVVMAAGAAFFFAAEVFVGFNVVYMAIAILLAIEDSDDIFRAFGNFYRRMMKLFRFYMELFKSIKEIIKWW